MKRKNKTSVIKKAVVSGTAILMSAITAISGFSVAFAKTNKFKNTFKFEGRKKVSLNAEALNTTIPSEEKLDELVEVQTPEVNNEVSTTETKAIESTQNSTNYTHFETKSFKMPKFEDNYSYNNVASNEDYITEYYSDIEEVTAAGSQLIESNEESFDCPKDETPEEREARIQALQAERDRIIQEEKERYAEYLAGFYDPLLKEYAKYYHLNGNKVVDIAKKMTNKYTIDMNNFIKGCYYDKNNIEAMIMMFVERLSKNKLTVSITKYGYTMASIITSNKVDRLNSNLILSNGKSFSSYFGEVCDMMGVNKYAALGLCFWETGRLQYGRSTNNFGGMMTSEVPVTPEAGIIAFIKLLRSYEPDYNVKLTTNYDDIARFGRTYCPGDSSWVNGVYSIAREVTRDKNKYFPTPVYDGEEYEGQSYMMRSDEITYGGPRKK